MRRTLEREGAPADLIQCLEKPSIPAAQYLMAQADMVQANGGKDMVKAAYSSGTPAYGVGAGNSTMVIDETADIAEAARNTRLSKTSDYGSGCSADGNLIVESTVYDALRGCLVDEGGHLLTAEEADRLRRIYWDDEGHRTPDTIAVSAQQLAQKAGFEIAPDRRFLLTEQTQIGTAQPVQLREAWRRAVALPLHAASMRRCARWRRSTRSAARATRAASTRSTTITSTASPGSPRSAGSWCASPSRRRTPAPSTTGCR